MNIKYAFLKKSKKTTINGVKHFGIKFIKKKTYEELFTKDEEVITRWYEYLKRYCIQTKFRMYFKSIKVLGKGNFAKVFLVQRKTDNKPFACKVFNKSEIFKDPLEKKCL